MPSTITYRDDWHTDTTIAIGQDYSIKREGACLDLHLHRALSVDCPLTLTILIRTDGSIAQWAAEFDGARGSNTYWHFASGPHHPITAEQLKTLAGIQRCSPMWDICSKCILSRGCLIEPKGMSLGLGMKFGRASQDS